MRANSITLVVVLGLLAPFVAWWTRAQQHPSGQQRARSLEILPLVQSHRNNRPLLPALGPAWHSQTRGEN